MTNFKYKGFEIELYRSEDSPYLFIWEAENKKLGIVLGDMEGGELGTVAYAKKKIKFWIVAFLKNKKELYPNDIVIRK